MAPLADQPAALDSWHAVAAAGNPALLHDLLADEVEFRSSSWTRVVSSSRQDASAPRLGIGGA